MVMSNEQYVLMRRMMAHNERVRVPNSERDKVYNSYAVRMLVLIGCLDYAMIELEESLRDSGAFCRRVKYEFNRAYRCVRDVHDEISRDIVGSHDAARRRYHELCDEGWWSIDEHVYIKDVNGSYSVVMGLSRLISSLNSKLSSRYDYRRVGALESSLRLLSSLGFEDKHLDIIIDKAVVIR